MALELPLDLPAVKPRMPSAPIVRSARIEGPYRWTMTRALAERRLTLNNISRHPLVGKIYVDQFRFYSPFRRERPQVKPRPFGLNTKVEIDGI